jgi:hypothetical protein
MEFFIKKNATLPVLKLQVVKDGRSDYNKMMDLIEESAVFFSMVDVETGIPKLITRPAGFVNKILIEPNSEPEYYVYYQFNNKDTNRVGRYEGQFLLKNNEGNLILPIREKLYINIQDSFIGDDLEYNNCYVSEFPCCIPSNIVTTTTTSQCYIDPSQPDLLLIVTTTEGSIQIKYDLYSSKPTLQNTTLNFTHILGVFTGSPITNDISLTINQNNNFTSKFLLIDADYNNLTFYNDFVSISTIPVNLNLEIIEIPGPPEPPTTTTTTFNPTTTTTTIL